MTESMHNYFRAEKAEALLFLAAGVFAVGFACWAFFVSKEKFYTGMAIPVLLVGLIQMVVGATVFFRTGQQVSALDAQFAANQAGFAASETARMIEVMRNFTIYKWVEIAFVLSGVALLIFRAANFWQGLALGLLMQGALMLTLDIFAERRGARYQHEIQQLISTN
jgi:drug/metabolite transporter (DMT)-like permease